LTYLDLKSFYKFIEVFFMNSLIFTEVTLDELKTAINEAISLHIPQINHEDRLQDLLKIEDLEKIFGVSRPTIYSWMRKGDLPFTKMGALTYFLKDEVLNALKNFPRKVKKG